MPRETLTQITACSTCPFVLLMLLLLLLELSIFKLENKFKLTHILFQLSVHFTVGFRNLHQNNTLEERKKGGLLF